MNLRPFFQSHRIAVIGASREPHKVGHTVFQQLVRHNFTVYPVNPSAKKILGKPCFPSVRDIPYTIDLAVICVPAQFVAAVLDDLGTKKVHHAIIITAGFKEVGNMKLDEELQAALKRNNILAIGPNCLGIFDAYTKFDTFFLPEERLLRPKPGGIGFISQSGATCSALMDLAAAEGFGFSKVISYGNAANIDESDLIAFLNNDKKTRVICLYVEGVHDGKKFLRTAKTCKKPLIILKGGTTPEGSHAAQSHTGSLAGSADVYFGAFKQAGAIIAHTLSELLDYAKAFDKITARAIGNRVQIITNGGGYGILTSDLLAKYSLELAPLGKHLRQLKSRLPAHVVVSNPFDVLGDATDERYLLALKAALSDTSNDAIVLILLTQTPLITHDLVSRLATIKRTKPLVIVTTGSEYSDKLQHELEAAGYPCYTFPEQAIRALCAYTRHKT